jgi:hypothetical protein
MSVMRCETAFLTLKYGRPKVVLIFLQLGVGRLLGMYMAYFQPFRQYLTVKVDGSD